MCILYTCIAGAAHPARPTIAMELLGYQQRRGLSNGAEHLSTAGARTRGGSTGTAAGCGDRVHRPAFSSVSARLGGARVQHHVTIGASKPFGTRARVSVGGSTLARPSVQARFVGAAVVQVWNTKRNSFKQRQWTAYNIRIILCCTCNRRARVFSVSLACAATFTRTSAAAAR